MNTFPIQINIQFAPLEPFSKRKVTEEDFFSFFNRNGLLYTVTLQPIFPFTQHLFCFVIM